MGKYYLGLQSGSQTNFSVVDGTGIVSDLDLSGLYLSVTGKAADSDLLDGQDSAYYRDISNITGTLRLSGYFTGDFTGYARVDAIEFNTGTTGAGTTPVGELEWADDLGTLKFGLKGGNITHYIGQQLHERVVNKTTGTLAKGTVVFVSGAQGNRITVEKAIATSDTTSATVFGVVAESIASEAEGFVTQDGLLQGLNTTGFTEGAVLWLSPTVSGAFTQTKPIAPDHLVMVGFCVRSHATVGEILVKVQNGYEIDELHNVRITGVTNGQFLAYNSTSGVWYNANLTGGANIDVTSNGGGSVTIATKSGSYTGNFVGTASNADLLDSQDSSYYLNVVNITGALTSGEALLLGDGSGRFANAVIGSGLLLTGGTLHATGAGGDANTLNGLSGSFYRDAGNLTGTLFVEITGTVPNSEKLNGESGSYYLNYANFTGTANASGTFSGIFRSNASTTGTAAVNLPHGIAPTSPVDGDLWTTNSGLYVQVSGSTVGPLSTGTAGGGGGGTIVDVFTGSATWTKPTGAVYIDVICIGGGGGGGSGRKGTGTTGAGTGGGGGALSRMGFSASIIGSTETVTVGAGGPGGASRTTNDTNGQAGTNGGTTSFGNWLRAGGGRGGNEGIAGANNGVSGGGAINVASPISNSVDAIGGQAAPGAAGLSFNAEYGGGAGGSSAGAGDGRAGGSSIYGGPGGGAGGGISGTTAYAGGAGGNTGAYTPGGGGAAGGIGANGAAGAAPSRSNCGTGGGGGGGSRTGNAGSGASGEIGAGGGGGGAGLNDVGNSGAGGNGGSGRVIVITYK